jgi:hypothetical protein
MATPSPSLASLKENVAQAAAEIRRLSSENQQLNESIQTLWANSSDPGQGATVSFKEDRELVRERLRRYIAIIDQHLDQHLEKSAS